ncbi:MAG: hypothetical protein ABFS42_04090 [Candidatus Krumholzibacteriota bacterium]
MKTLLTILLLTIPLAALAQPDPSPDVMGVYFDIGGNQTEIHVPASVPFNAYVVLRNPTQAEITGYEFGYDHWVPPGNEGMVFLLAADLLCDPITIDPPTSPLVGSYGCEPSQPVPATPAVVLLTWQYMLLGVMPMHFNLTPADTPTVPGDLPGYWGPSGITPTEYAETCFGTGARVNEFCPVAVEPQSWGSLKGLFR